jgi:ABC-type nickel/cobalt efflux system permease component RcnA
MRNSFARPALTLLALACVLASFIGQSHAQSSLGIGTNDAIAPSTGLFSHWLLWINQHQQAFYRSLSTTMKAMRDDGSNMWLLVGLSFAYGVFHAAGPGHGKAVISSYMVANEVALRRGVVLSFASALLQALTAIAVMLLAWFVLRGTSVSMTDAAWFLEIASYVFLTAFGAWLLWQKVRHFRHGAHGHHHDAHHHHDGAHHHHHGEVCSSCGHSHAPDPVLLSKERFGWRAAWSAVVAVGIRPCSGALIVLSFALLNGLWLAGILSVLGMALGTAITVSVLAILAVTAKNWAVRLAGDGRPGSSHRGNGRLGNDYIHSAVEIAAATFVFLLGLLLLTASLSA